MATQGSGSPEAALQADAAGGRAILDALGDAVLVHDAASGDILEVNRKFCELVGYSPQEARRLNLRDLAGDGRYPPESPVPGQPSGLLEWQIRDRSGRQLWVEAQLNGMVYQGRERVCAVLRDISPRKQAEATRLEFAPFFRLVTEESLAGVYLIQDEKFRYVNPILAQKFGYRPDEIIDQLGPLDLAHPDDRELLAVNLRRRLSREEPAAQYCFRGRRRDGSTIYCEILSRSSEYQGRPAVMGIFLDITERVQAEEDRHASEARYRAIIDNQTELVTRFLPDTTVTFANEANCRYFGVTLQEFRSGGFLRFIPEEDRPLVKKAVAGLNQDNPIAVVEHRVVNGQGQIRWQQWINRAIFDDQGRILEYQGVGRDISEQKAAEEALKETQERFQQLADNLEAVFWMRPLNERRLIYINAAYERIWGRTIDSLMERPETWLEAVHPEDQERLRQRSKRRSTSDFGEDEYRIVRPDGQVRWINTRTFPVRDEQGEIYRVAGISVDITERKQAEETLRASEDNYRTIFNTVDDGIAVIDLETGSFVDVNQKWCQMTGLNPEEARGLKIASLCLDEPPFTGTDAVRWIKDAAKQGPQFFEYVARTREGRRYWVEINLRRTVIAGQERLLAVVRDVTERKQAEEALRTSEAKYRNLVEQIPAITYIAAMDNLSGAPVYISPQISNILGFTPEEWLADPELYKKQIHSEDRSRLLTELLLSYSRGGPFSAEYRLLSKTGRIVWVRDESRAVYDSEGRPLFVQGVMVDITKRKKAEEALREVNSKLQALVQASPLAIISLDLQKKVISWNPAAERIFGWRQEEVLGRPYPLISEAQAGEFRQFWEQLLQGRHFVGLEIQRRGKDGAFIDVSLSNAPLYDADGNIVGAIGVIEDITDRKRTEEALRASEARFRAIFEEAPIGIALMSLNRATLQSNPAMREMSGYGEAELNLTHGLDLTHPDDVAADRAMFTELVAGKRNRYQLEKRYRHKQGRWVWARLSVSLVRDAAGQPQFAISMVEDISQRKQAQEAAEKIRRQQEALLSNIPDMAWLKDRDGRMIAVNEPYALASGKATQDLVGKHDQEIWLPHLAGKYRADDLEVIRTGQRKRLEEPVVNSQGQTFWVETIKSPVFNEHREVIGTAGVARDITERRRMEEALHRVSRGLKAVTECRQALLRATNETELLNEVCRIIVEVGGYRMAWVGFGRQDEDKSVEPMAQKGFDEGYVQSLNITWAETEKGRGPVGRTIRTGKPAITRDTQKDPNFAPWREEARKRGYNSVLALPLGDRRPFGALTIYATEPNAFDDEEINLLIGLANDLAFGLKALRTGVERHRAEEALRQSETKYRSLMDGASDAIVLANSGGEITEVNRKAVELLGYPETALLGMNYTRIHPARILDHVLENFKGILTTGLGPLHECLVKRRDGAEIPVDITHIMVENGDHGVVQAVFRDITERKRAEEALRDSEQKLRLLASQLLAVQEKERRRVSRELHDELGQALTVLKIHLVAIENGLHEDQQDLKANCERLLKYIDTVIENVRRLSWDLSPSSLEDLGLSSSLKYLVEDICRNNHMHYSLTMDKIDNLFSPETRINIYRIFQESFTNIVRHAEASRIDVEIKKEKDRVTFRLKDDGKGFEVKKARSRHQGKRGLGLTTMHERALMADGALNIWSRKNKGTEITLTIPLKK